MTVVLALDISLRSTGFAFDGPTGRPLTGTWGVPRSSACHGEDGYAFQKWLRSLVGAVGPGAIVAEAPYMPGGKGGGHMQTTRDTLISLTGLFYAANIIAAERVVRMLAATPSQARAHFCGTGRAGKDGVMARCRALGWTFANDDEADSLALFAWAKAQLREPIVNVPMFGSRAAAEREHA